MLIAFFALTLVLTIPFRIAGGLADVALMPGLPLAALAVVAPALAATLLTARAGGRAEVQRLFSRLGDAGRLSPRGWVASLCLPLAVAAVSSVWLGAHGQQVRFISSPLAAAALLCAFLVGAAAEEIGWTGFALERLEQRFGQLHAGLLLGLFWAVWHYPALFEAHRDLDWIAWWSLWTVASRLVMTDLYFACGRSLGGAILFHATGNFAWQLAPDGFDPTVEAIAMLLVAILVRTLSVRRLDRT